MIFFLRSILSALILVFTRECWEECKFLFLTLGLHKVLPTVDSRCLQPSREIERVRVIGSSKQITGSKEIGKWWEGKAIKQKSIQEWTLNLNWSDKKVKTKNLLGCFEINSMFRTSVHGFFPDLSRAYNMVRVIEGKIVQK